MKTNKKWRHKTIWIAGSWDLIGSLGPHSHWNPRGKMDENQTETKEKNAPRWRQHQFPKGETLVWYDEIICLVLSVFFLFWFLVGPGWRFDRETILVAPSDSKGLSNVKILNGEGRGEKVVHDVETGRINKQKKKIQTNSWAGSGPAANKHV